VETLRRVVEGVYRVQERHCKSLGLPWSTSKAQRSAQEMFERMFSMKFLPPGRGLWAMGTEYVERVGSAALFNCGFVSTADLKISFSTPFCWLMDMSMLGVGVGFDTLGANAITVQQPKYGTSDHLQHDVEDSREGWVELVRRTLDAYNGVGTLPELVNYDLVRPAGAPLRGFGGVAAGSGPLVMLISEIHKVLLPLIGQKITSEAIVDLMNVIGKCVVSGNIRRSAELAMGDPNDESFLNLKNPKLHQQELMNHRWASNNSIVATVGMDYSKIAPMTAANGEPGYIWLENARGYGRLQGEPDNSDANVAGFNPCVEQPLEPFEMCCLVETFPSRHDSYEDYQRTLKFAYMYGKTVTLIPSHDERTNAVILKNRRIGTSQSGIVQSFQRHGRREHFRWCEQGYAYLRTLDNAYSNWLCVPRSIKVTTVKPSGTVSLLPGVTPGIHYPHAEFYFRTIRFNATSHLITKLEAANYRIEIDAYSPNTLVVYFPVHEPYFDRSKDEVSMWEQLENTAQMQRYWSDNGVSATITFAPHEAKSIKYALELYETRLKAISFLPLENHGYQQAPYIQITKDEFDSYAATLKPIIWGDTKTHDVEDAYCDGEACALPVRP
jgi:adenosylcobalamin-dependent ribonucleoside-triphosphate reductase